MHQGVETASDAPFVVAEKGSFWADFKGEDSGDGDKLLSGGGRI